jgi:hypothetical protein
MFPKTNRHCEDVCFQQVKYHRFIEPDEAGGRVASIASLSKATVLLRTAVVLCALINIHTYMPTVSSTLRRIYILSWQ